MSWLQLSSSSTYSLAAKRRPFYVISLDNLFSISKSRDPRPAAPRKRGQFAKGSRGVRYAEARELAQRMRSVLTHREPLEQGPHAARKRRLRGSMVNCLRIHPRQRSADRIDVVLLEVGRVLFGLIKQLYAFFHCDA